MIPITHREAVGMSLNKPMGKLYIKVNGRLHNLYLFIGAHDNAAVFEYSNHNFTIPVFENTEFFKEK